MCIDCQLHSLVIEPYAHRTNPRLFRSWLTCGHILSVVAMSGCRTLKFTSLFHVRSLLGIQLSDLVRPWCPWMSRGHLISVELYLRATSVAPRPQKKLKIRGVPFKLPLDYPGKGFQSLQWSFICHFSCTLFQHPGLFR